MSVLCVELVARRTMGQLANVNNYWDIDTFFLVSTFVYYRTPTESILGLAL